MEDLFLFLFITFGKKRAAQIPKVPGIPLNVNPVLATEIISLEVCSIYIVDYTETKKKKSFFNEIPNNIARDNIILSLGQITQ